MTVVVPRRKLLVLLALAAFLAPLALLSSYNWLQSLKETTNGFVVQNQEISGELNSLKDRLSHAEYLLHLRQKRLYFMNASRLATPCGNDSQPEEVLSREGQLEIPTVFQHLPHLLGKAGALIPRVSIGKNRDKVSLVIGVPTVQRSTHNYIDETLESLLRNLKDSEEKDVVIVVMVADITNLETVDVFINELQTTFAQYIEKGVLEIIAPSVDYYPDLNALPSTLGDPPERMKWRAKQVLDFAYLMMYGHKKGVYYMQLEDDVVTKPSYVTKIKNFAGSQEGYVMMEFSSLGFISKLFKSSDLPNFVEFLLMFYETKPIDWLLANYLFVKVCLDNHEAKYCPKALEKAIRKYKPSLFQHMGVESSLKGKVQKLREKDFGKVELFIPHTDNPPAKKLSTSLKVYQSHTLEDAYAGKSYFWALNPQPGDGVTVEFSKPTLLTYFLFKSGNAEHPTDQFYDAVVEIATEPGKGNETYTWSQVGSFKRGIAEGSLAGKTPALAIRIRATAESAFWVSLREIWIK
ncbi:hypothetical protein RvY_05478 [Ramazzottius varieornatus]|uniref:Uncharacterized protein n=1 Tax=Ramazzottius varieornatus TaxID=947166 RepID=A0A1D1V0R4_RAMVA|nr:hypothetical protein RvY_05478 [Ramazzottius varieornatus]